MSWHNYNPKGVSFIFWTALVGVAAVAIAIIGFICWLVKHLTWTP